MRSSAIKEDKFRNLVQQLDYVHTYLTGDPDHNIYAGNSAEDM